MTGRHAGPPTSSDGSPWRRAARVTFAQKNNSEPRKSCAVCGAPRYASTKFCIGCLSYASRLRLPRRGSTTALARTTSRFRPDEASTTGRRMLSRYSSPERRGASTTGEKVLLALLATLLIALSGSSPSVGRQAGVAHSLPPLRPLTLPSQATSVPSLPPAIPRDSLAPMPSAGGHRQSVPPRQSRARDLQVSALSTSTRVTGLATWYCCTKGWTSDRLFAAAGSELRQGRWRHRTVTVTGPNGRTIRLPLVDWCLCSGTRVIDLSPAAFRMLAPLSRGVVSVTVGW